MLVPAADRARREGGRGEAPAFVPRAPGLAVMAVRLGRILVSMAMRLAFALCLALGFFGLGYEASHGAHALYEHWYCASPVIVIVVGALLGLFDYRRGRPA